MSRFSEGLKIIPRIAWYLAFTFYIGFSTLALTVLIPSDRQMRTWPLAGKLGFAYGLFFIFVPWVLLIGFIYADAKRRGMRYAMWTWLAALIPDAIGIIIYFILRDPLPRPCPGCSTPVKGRLRVLSLLRNGDETEVPELRPRGGAWLGELPGMRIEAAGADGFSAGGVGIAIAA